MISIEKDRTGKIHQFIKRSSVLIGIIFFFAGIGIFLAAILQKEPMNSFSDAYFLSSSLCICLGSVSILIDMHQTLYGARHNTDIFLQAEKYIPETRALRIAQRIKDHKTLTLNISVCFLLTSLALVALIGFEKIPVTTSSWYNYDISLELLTAFYLTAIAVAILLIVDYLITVYECEQLRFLHAQLLK